LDFRALRYSLLSLGLGTIKVYLLTYKKEDGLKLYKFLYLCDIVKLPLEGEVTEKVNNYHDHLETIGPREIENEIDFLKYKIEGENSRKNIAYGKINNYTAILLVIIPIIFASGLDYLSKQNNIILVLLVVAIFYNMLNLTIFIFDFYKVKLFLRSTFGGLKNSGNCHLQKLAESYYEDWYSIKSESVLFVTYVRNIEKYMKSLMFFIILFIIIFISLNNFNSGKEYYPKLNDKSSSYSFDVKLDSGKILSLSELHDLNEMHNRLLGENIKQIIILKENHNSKVANERYRLILNYIKMNNINKVDIIEINQDPKNRRLQEDLFIKILIIGG